MRAPEKQQQQDVLQTCSIRFGWWSVS
uniref:Uncharacterized protein n=1 Tax=Arundo donax TaxID=35708 RepID=A0A0A9GN40_ARUDO